MSKVTANSPEVSMEAFELLTKLEEVGNSMAKELKTLRGALGSRENPEVDKWEKTLKWIFE